ncbi:hypothetical protein ACIA5C_47145 [Actinoplanes sp. NPDC051343]|uniref:hypothetical protein n=1 Tax=Actinoplanes sp. NPDC051343 TaxID=3363906 RepID=UPI0037A9409A
MINIVRFGPLSFTDMIRKPVQVLDLADTLLELAVSDYAGILNVAGSDPINRYDLGVFMARREVWSPPGPRLDPGGNDRRDRLRLPTDVRQCTDSALSLLNVRLRGAHESMAMPLA